MTTNQTSRVLELLKRFNSGQIVCIESLKNEALWESMSERNIRRDLAIIKEHFPESFETIKGKKSCYKAITKNLFDNFLNRESIAFLSQAFNMAQRSSFFDTLQIDENDKRIIKNRLEESKKCYEFITKPYESKKGDVELFREIERAIHYKRYCQVLHEEEGGIKSYEIKPYKIVFMSENFYLACENTDERYPFTKFRISNIKEIKVDSKTFYKNPDIEDFIKSMQTPFSIYKEGFRNHLIEVIVEVDKSKAKFFKAKSFLPSQKILKTKESGDIVISYSVTQELEMEELVKRWIPYIRVIEPLALKTKIEDEIKRYIDSIMTI